MPRHRIAVLASVASIVLLASELPSQGAPLMPTSPVSKSATANANTLEVRYGGWHGGWGGWRGGWGGWGWGLGAGALVGAAIAAPYYYGGYAPYYYGSPYPYYYGYPGYYAGYYQPYGYGPYWRNRYYGYHRAYYY